MVVSWKSKTVLQREENFVLPHLPNVLLVLTFFTIPFSKVFCCCLGAFSTAPLLDLSCSCFGVLVAVFFNFNGLRTVLHREEKFFHPHSSKSLLVLGRVLHHPFFESFFAVSTLLFLFWRKENFVRLNIPKYLLVVGHVLHRSFTKAFDVVWVCSCSSFSKVFTVV